MTDVKLRPCPFCQGRARVENGDSSVRIKCTKCGGSGRAWSHYMDAAKSWNIRSESPVEKAAGEMYKALEARQEADAAWKNDKTAHNVCHDMTKRAEEFARTALDAFDKAKKEGK